jgi:peptidoglycan-N-acetylglucosamine deacetylase
MDHPNYAAMLRRVEDGKGQDGQEQMKLQKFQGAAARPLLTTHALSAIALALSVCCASAGTCPESAAGIGTTRVVSVDPVTLHRIGSVQYPQTLPLRDHEIVLSFDDGPSPLTTGKVLDALAAECVKANFFMIGASARMQPDLVRRAYNEGHTIGTHTQTHADLSKLPLAAAEREIDDGIRSVQAALGLQMSAAPFFRAPYLQMTPDLQEFLVKRDVMLWSVDIDPEDWRPQSAEDLVEHALALVDAKRSGIVLLHDVQPHTAAALPDLLRELRARGYKIVHAVAPDAEAKPVAISNDVVSGSTSLK